MEKHRYKIALVGGDSRQKLLHKNLVDNNFLAEIIASSDVPYRTDVINTAQIVILPIVVTFDGINLNTQDSGEIISLERVLRDAENCKYIVCGKIPTNLKIKLNERGIFVFEYTDDEVFKIKNAVPTAEGAISIAISNTAKTICNSNCLVIGNGCIGKVLSNQLKSLGANVTVSARKSIDFSLLQSSNFDILNTTAIPSTDLNKFDIIFNTVPKQIITSDQLKKLSKEQLIIDLASSPYGLEHKNVTQYDAKILLASSLPAKFAPITSANATADVVINYINEVMNNE